MRPGKGGLATLRPSAGGDVAQEYGSGGGRVRLRLSRSPK